MKWFQRTPVQATRWVVVDCETSGLDIARDRLLSVGAVAVREGRVQLADAYEARVRQDRPSAPENIVIHGIGGDAQVLQGKELDTVVREFSAYLGEGVPVAFHAAFDAGILRRHGLKARAQWLDLAAVAPALYPDLGGRDASLDHWLAAFGIPAQARHDALGDAFATAQLLLILLNEAQRQRLDTVEALMKTQRAGRWLARR
ncbi:MAG TPA: 3'-5' exonuclease [Burkholderiales bacterium]|nr:3'-5' exonuclease [Burkholderiales bacterium]